MAPLHDACSSVFFGHSDLVVTLVCKHHFPTSDAGAPNNVFIPVKFFKKFHWERVSPSLEARTALRLPDLCQTAGSCLKLLDVGSPTFRNPIDLSNYVTIALHHWSQKPFHGPIAEHVIPMGIGRNTLATSCRRKVH